MAEHASPVHASLTLRSGRDGLATVYPWFDSIAKRIALPDDSVFRIQLVLEEAVSNVALHGFDADRAGEISLEVAANPVQVIAVLRDQGRPFDPLTDAPASPLPQSLEEAAIGGAGIRLMRKFATALRYRRIGATNELTLTFDVRNAGDVRNPGDVRGDAGR